MENFPLYFIMVPPKQQQKTQLCGRNEFSGRGSVKIFERVQEGAMPEMETLCAQGTLWGF